MSKFKAGDKVELKESYQQFPKGLQFVVSRVYGSGYDSLLDGLLGCTAIFAHRVKLVENSKPIIKEKNSMTKYYRVIKEHPVFALNAIVSNEKNIADYSVMDSVFLTDIGEKFTTKYYEVNSVVENAPEFYERVYPIGKLNKMLFGDKKQAQAAAAAMYQGE